MVNTGWTGRPYSIGTRIPLQYTRTLISAALNGKFDAAKYQVHPVLGLHMPQSCPGIPQEILNPYLAWENKEQYEQEAKRLAEVFIKNF